MYMASLTGVEIASRLPVISAEAIEPWSPGTHGADALVDRLAHAVDERRRSAATGRAATGGATVLIVPSTKPEAPMRWKYMSRAKS